MWRVGIDVGGTFTDFFAWNEEDGSYRTAKVLTTKDDRSRGVMQSIEAAGIPFEEISFLMHGTTTATNSLIERDYPDAAFVTTQGFRDTIEIGRQHRESLYDPYQTKPKPLISRRNRFSINERMSAKGNVRRPLNEDEAREIGRKIKEGGYQAVGIGFINSYANDAHERRMRDIILESAPNVHVVISADTRPVFREHGRFTTTAIRACLMPIMTTYFDRLSEVLSEHGFRGKLLILKSNGGVMGAQNAKLRPEELIESGPAGGVAYASYLCRTTGFENIIHTDVGGTSFDVSIVEKGQGLITRDYELEWEVPVSVPMLDIHSVGAGGGSIGWVDEGGSLRMGPQSAGSTPGPACYGRGGTEPTITDANLVLGRLNPSLSDKFELDVSAAEAAIDRLAAQVGLSRLETADGMIKISCETMAQAVKGVVVARARDPRDFVLASFGGAGPMHACFVAQAMSIPKVVIPGAAGVASAFGATAMDMRHDIEIFHYSPLDSVSTDDLNNLYAQIEDEARDRLKADGIDASSVELRRTAQMRYVGQTYEVETDIPSLRLKSEHVPSIGAAFHSAHEKEYGVCNESFPIAFVSLSVTAIGKMKTPPVYDFSGTQMNDSQGSRPVYFDGEWHDAALYDGKNIGPGAKMVGPAVVEYLDSIAVIPPHCSAEADTSGNLIVNINTGE
jgi:N-methylhydantoinase A